MATPSDPSAPEPAAAPAPAAPAAPSYSTDPALYIYTSLTAGSSHIVTATSRLETILRANRVPFKAIDLATDQKARMIWGRRAGKDESGRVRKLPGLVQMGMVLGVSSSPPSDSLPFPAVYLVPILGGAGICACRNILQAALCQTLYCKLTGRPKPTGNIPRRGEGYRCGPFVEREEGGRFEQTR